jgi:hypothetical protein
MTKKALSTQEKFYDEVNLEEQFDFKNAKLIHPTLKSRNQDFEKISTKNEVVTKSHRLKFTPSKGD